MTVSSLEGEGAAALESISSLAKLLSVSESTIRAGIRAGEIPTVSIGRRVLVPRQFVTELVAGATVREAI